MLPINDIVKIKTNLSPRSAVRSGFNIALIIGSSAVISASDRVKLYSGLEAMEVDGFTKEMPEYKQASLYFMASTIPGRLAVGYWDSTEETLAQAVNACRKANWEWYLLALHRPLIDDNDVEEFGIADIESVAGFIETCSPSTAMFCATADVDVLSLLKEKEFNNTLGIYTEVSPFITSALAGWAMGANTGADNSAFALAYKSLRGVTVDDLDDDTVKLIEKANGNIYVNRGSKYNSFEPGTMASGIWFDEIINIHMLENNLQLAVMDLLSTKRKIPGTEAGVLMIVASLLPELDAAVRIGFIAPGIWDGPPIMDLETGDAVPNGYVIQNDPVESLNQADRETRVAPPIYIALKLAGALQYVVIQIDVNR